ncbi:DUF1707 domain-containing protein [Propioniciclava flava]
MLVDPRTSASLRVGDAERSHAEAVLQEAYSVGRLNEGELDVRLGMAMRARTRRELSAALSGLPLQVRATPFVQRRVSTPDATLLGSLAHGSAVFTWFLGPLVCYGVASPGTPGRREAAHAFNLQLTSGLVVFVTMVMTMLFFPTRVLAVLVMVEMVVWLLLTVTSAARALSGRPLKVPTIGFLPEGKARSRRP